MYIIVGLGNPGERYAFTKHNAGFLCADILAERHGIKINKHSHKALVGSGFIGREKVLLVKPQTYMNLSGESVGSIMRYYDILPEELILIYDDIDIPMGTLRLRKEGGPGTHNGMRNVIKHLSGETNFPRVRVGIGGDMGPLELYDYVTSGFTKEQVPIIEAAITRAADAVELLIEKDIEAAMQKYNG